MFISKLRNKLQRYDPYGEHFTNGLKAVFVLELLFLFNYVYKVPNPYFYYFYVPLTAFAAEIAGNTLEEKYLLYFFTVMGSVLAVFLFGMFSIYPLFFVFFVFGYSLLIYFTAIYKLKSMLVPAPLILSLAVYSLIYDKSNSNFYLALNHALETIVAMLVVMAGLRLFPKHYYLAIWRKAFISVLQNLITTADKIYQGEIEQMAIIPGTVIMKRYSQMLSPRMKCYSVLKITLLTFELVVAMSYLVAFYRQLRWQYIAAFHHYLEKLLPQVKNRQALLLTTQDLKIMHETYELRILAQLIKSWNHLCTA